MEWILVYGVLLTLSGLSYFCLLMLIILGLGMLKSRIRKQAKYKSTANSSEEIDPNLPSVTVVVAARNEEKNLPETLQSLSQQNYPTDLFEIIVVDDRSTDRTAAIVTEYASQKQYIKLIRQTEVTPGNSPKKQALELGINAASGEIIITTDADCLHDPDWVYDLISHFKPKVGMVAGQARSILPPDAPLWQRLQTLDFQTLGYASAGLITSGMPFHCNGANLAFRKSVFKEIEGWKGYNRLVSGDDELLMAKVAKSKWKIIAAASPSTIVKAKPVKTLKALWFQRIRWGSKGLYYRLSRKLVLTGVFIFFLVLIAGPFIGIAGAGGLGLLFWKIWLQWVIIRFLFDGTALLIGSRIFGEKYRSLDFLLAETIYPIAIVIFAVAGHFTRFKWKGQEFRSRGRN